MNEHEYLNMKFKEIDDFQEIVNNCEFEVMQLTLNSEWFNKVRELGQKSWFDENIPYCGEFFAFRWLYEECQFEHINNSLKEFYSVNSKKM